MLPWPPCTHSHERGRCTVTRAIAVFSTSQAQQPWELCTAFPSKVLIAGDAREGSTAAKAAAATAAARVAARAHGRADENVDHTRNVYRMRRYRRGTENLEPCNA